MHPDVSPVMSTPDRRSQTDGLSDICTNDPVTGVEKVGLTFSIPAQNLICNIHSMPFIYSCIDRNSFLSIFSKYHQMSETSSKLNWLKYLFSSGVSENVNLSGKILCWLSKYQFTSRRVMDDLEISFQLAVTVIGQQRAVML